MAETCATCHASLSRDPVTGALKCPSCPPSPPTPFREPETWELGTGKEDLAPGSPEPLPKDFGQYEVLGEITRGGMGVIYRVRQKHLQRVVAMKVLIAGRDASGEQVKRFLREARAAARLRHPNIVSIHDVGSAAGKVYFTMDLIEGESLHERLRRGRIPPREGVEILRQVARAVQYAHESGVIHRDIKPGNILIDKEGRALLTDFGLARTLDSETLHTRSGTTMGTPHYMSPEQAQGETALIDARSDVYSLGAVFYEILTGVPPFVSEREVDILLKVIHEEPLPPAKRDPKVHRDLQTICMTAIEKSRDRRYASAKDFAADLEAFLQGEPIRARPASLAYTAAKKLRKHRGVAAAAFAGILVSIGIFAYKEWQAQEKRILDDAEAQKRAEAEERERTRRTRLDQATAALTEGRLDDAVRLFDDFLGQHPDAPESELSRALFQKGVALMQRGDERMDAGEGRTPEGKAEVASLFAAARGVFDDLVARFPATEEAREAPFWTTKTWLWEEDYEAFDARFTELCEKTGASRVTLWNDVGRGASKRVLQGFDRWFVQRSRTRPSQSPAEILTDIQTCLVRAMSSEALQKKARYEEALPKAQALLNLGFERRLYPEILTWTGLFIEDKDYEPLRRYSPFFRMWAELRRARAFAYLEQDQPIVDLLGGWDERFPSPEAEFRSRFPEGNPRERFLRENPKPERWNFPQPAADRDYQMAMFRWQQALRQWEAAHRATEYDNALLALNTYNAYRIEGGGTLARALKNLGRQADAVACYESLAELVKGSDEWTKARLDLWRLTTQVEMGNTAEAQRRAKRLQNSVDAYLSAGTRSVDDLQFMAMAYDEIGNFGFLKALQTTGPAALPIFHESEGSYARAAEYAALARSADPRAEDLFASILVKLGLVRFFQNKAPEAVEAFQTVVAGQERLKEPFHAHVAHLMLRNSSPEEFLAATGDLTEPTLKNDVPFWLAMRSWNDQRYPEAAAQLNQSRDQSRGREWPYSYVEPMLRLLPQ